VSAGERECERSALVNEEIVYFIFQLELDAQLQRALNYEAYEAAQQIRAKRETVSVVTQWHFCKEYVRVVVQCVRIQSAAART
jgi:hypothetical protein